MRDLDLKRLLGEHSLLAGGVRLPPHSENFPRILSCVENPDEFCLSLDVTPGLSWFRGHFPGQPVLPGILHIHWAILVASGLFGLEDPPQHIKRLKFSKAIVPPRVVELRLQRLDPFQVQFNFQSLDQQNSQGRLVFAEPEA
jgi:3-hydroxymyristoyl/3-hydroxydecanoyl-(acyl carrier protein) dehydratase